MRKSPWFLVALLGIGIAAADPAGQVQGPDSSNPGNYVITLPAELKVSSRDVVRILHNGTVVTEARIVQVQVDRITVHPKDSKATIAAGDAIEYVGPPKPTVGGPLKPRVLQSGFHLTVSPGSTFTDDSGHWAANVFVSNDGDEVAWVHVGCTLTANTGEKNNFIDHWMDLQPGEMQTVTFTSGWRSPYGRNNDQNRANADFKSNWSATNNNQVAGITSVSCEVRQTSGSKGKPRTQ